MAASMNVCLGSRASYTRCSAAATSKRAQQLQAARSFTCSSQMYLTSWDAPRQSNLALQQTVQSTACAGAPKRQVVRMGNKGAGGPFAPLVVVVRGVVGEKEFNKLRGKAISLHSQVIKDFCKQLGVDNKQVQGVIRLAKKNGEKLGFLA